MLVVGLGTQGTKRKASAGPDFVSAVDPANPEAEYRMIQEVPTDSYDGAFVCTPDDQKPDVLEFLALQGKHILCEKPLLFSTVQDLKDFERLCTKQSIFFQTAYNHRFEPSFVEMKRVIELNLLGKIYSISLFYGNGTARDVQNSLWRDRDDGVISDLGSHLMDTVRFWFPDLSIEYSLNSVASFESQSPDYARIESKNSSPLVSLEMTTCMWKNTFRCDVIGEKGSAHIVGLCKWGPSTFALRERVFPSGKPIETIFEYSQGDPTWNLEYENFRDRVRTNSAMDLSRDLYILTQLQRIRQVSRVNR